MATANEQWLDALISRQVALARLGPTLAADVARLLDATEVDMVNQIRRKAGGPRTRKRVLKLIESVIELRSKAWVDAAKKYGEVLVGVAKNEPIFLDRRLKAAVPSVLVTSLPTAGALVDTVTVQPFEGRTMRQWVQRQRANDLYRLGTEIQIGITQGQTTEEIARRLVGTVRQRGVNGATQITRNHARSLARTAITHVANASRQEYYAANAELFTEELFVATLDARTTIVCGSNDGKRFPIGEGPRPPLHWRCRSLRVAIIDPEPIGERPTRNFTEKSLLREYSSRRNMQNVTSRDKLPRGHKGSFDEFARRRKRELTGRAPASMTYEQWLKSQPAAVQDDILGPTRARMFRNGELKLSQFINKQGDRFTLEDLERMAG